MKSFKVFVGQLAADRRCQGTTRQDANTVANKVKQNIEVADLDLWASDTDDTLTRTKITATKPECADMRASGRLPGLQQVCDPGMAVAIQPHPTHISRGTQTVQVTSHNRLQPDSTAAQRSKASAVSIHQAGAHQATRGCEKPASQNSHPNLPASCQHVQLPMEHKLKLAALHEEKEAQTLLAAGPRTA
ncbi:hypothetical protein WJX82_002421 [Trebouxia sp. C0006]